MGRGHAHESYVPDWLCIGEAILAGVDYGVEERVDGGGFGGYGGLECGEVRVGAVGHVVP